MENKIKGNEKSVASKMYVSIVWNVTSSQKNAPLTQ